jgi:hypothetical protein
MTPQKYLLSLSLSYLLGQGILLSMPDSVPIGVMLATWSVLIAFTSLLYRYARRRLSVHSLVAPISLLHLNRRAQLEDTLRDLRVIPSTLIVLLSLSLMLREGEILSPATAFTVIWLILAIKLNRSLVRIAELEIAQCS